MASLSVVCATGIVKWNEGQRPGRPEPDQASGSPNFLSLLTTTTATLVQVASTLQPFRPSNLVSHFSVLMAGESSILVVAPGESMQRVYSLPQLPMVQSGSLEAIQHHLTLNTL